MLKYTVLKLFRTVLFLVFIRVSAVLKNTVQTVYLPTLQNALRTNKFSTFHKVDYRFRSILLTWLFACSDFDLWIATSFSVSKICTTSFRLILSLSCNFKAVSILLISQLRKNDLFSQRCVISLLSVILIIFKCYVHSSSYPIGEFQSF